ncbi:MAG: phosphoribosylglycinamide formyltransferase [Deltaproteobacteria bacterium]|nr:phosphoribosylglycinamide formyltransferase [Deltaproteobacteria bacterium]
MSRLKLGVLVSGNGSNLQAILDAIGSGLLQAELRLVVSDNPKAYALERAQKAGIPFAIIEKKNFENKTLFEKALISFLKKAEVDWVVLAGFMKILSADFLNEFPSRIVNIHPSLLPTFPGLNAIEQAWNYGVKVTGCTVHLVDEGCDTGPILGQTPVLVEAEDNLESLTKKIHAAEHELYPRVLQNLVIKNSESCRGGASVPARTQPYFEPK